VSTSDSVRRSSHRQAGREAGHTRRSVLALSAASLAIGCESSTQRPVPLNNPLKDIGIARGRVFGCALRPEALDRPEELVLAARECALIAPIPMFVAPLLHRAPNVFDEADWARFKSFADACGATLHGHTLIWHRRTPTWSADWAREGRGRDALLLHVDATVRRFRGRLTSWDVVNEPLHHLSERPDGLRQSLWLEGAGADYVADAFTVAHEADPDAVLVLNEYLFTSIDPQMKRKRWDLIALLTKLLSRGVPVHALGVQGHIYSDHWHDKADAIDFLRAVREMDVKLFVSEFDVRDQRASLNPAARDREVSDAADRFFELFHEAGGFERLVVWSLSDRRGWIQTRYPRPDAAPVRPSLYDRALEPKPLRGAIARALSA